MQVYIHIPFCDLKCKYCRFASIGKIQNLHIDKYVSFLCEEIEALTPSPSPLRERGVIVKTIYFGGGTPSVLSEKNLEDIFKSLKEKFVFSENIEITLESTPNNITLKNLKIWESLGINRLSIGIQTLNKRSLEEIGRGKKGDIDECFKNLEKYLEQVNKMQPYNCRDTPCGYPTNKTGQTQNLSLQNNCRGESCIHPIIENISLDFIIGLPYVKKGEILENIKYVLNKYDFIKHISVYMLEQYYNPDKIIETKYDNITYPKSWDKLGLKDDEYLEEYSSIKKYLLKQGFINYEISNFAKPGSLCKHNKGYWEHNEVLGFGMGAGGIVAFPPETLPSGERGQEQFIRYLNADNFKDYYAGKKIFEEKLTKNDIFLEKVMFGLRTSGLKKEIYQKLNKKKIEYFLKNGYLNEKYGIIRLTDKGIVVLDFILKEII